MTLTLIRPPETAAPASLAVIVLAVHRDGAPIGEVFLDAAGRVLRRGRRVPRDVVLKILVLVTRRGEIAGQLRGRDGRSYDWCVAGTD